MKEFHWRWPDAPKHDFTHLGRTPTNASTVVSVPCLALRQDKDGLHVVPADDPRPRCAICFPPVRPDPARIKAALASSDPVARPVKGPDELAIRKVTSDPVPATGKTLAGLAGRIKEPDTMPTPAPKPASDHSATTVRVLGPPSLFPEEVFEAIELPKRKGVREALRAIGVTPGITVPDLARRVGLDVRPTGAIAKALHKKGLIEVRLAYNGDGKEQRLHYLAGNLAGMLRVKAQRFLKAAEALEKA